MLAVVLFLFILVDAAPQQKETIARYSQKTYHLGP